MRQIGTYELPFNYDVKIEGMLDARMLVPSYADLLLFTEDDYLPNGFIVSVMDANPVVRGLYQLLDNTDLANPNSWEKLGSSSAPSTIQRIIDRIPSYTPTTDIAFINDGDDIFYDVNGIEIVADTTYSFAYGDADYPTITFKPRTLYALEPDDTNLEDSSFLGVDDALVKVSTFTREFMSDYLDMFGSVNVHVKSANLIVSVSEIKASLITTLQIREGSPTGSIIYTATLPLTDKMLNVLDILDPTKTYYVVIASSATDDINIASYGKALVTKTQNLTAIDSSNGFQSPIQIFID